MSYTKILLLLSTLCACVFLSAQNKVSETIKKENFQKNKILAKLKSIRIKRLAFDGNPISFVVEKLQTASKENDPEKNGVKIILSHPQAHTTFLDIRVDNIILEDALKYICKSSDLAYDIKDDKIVISPKMSHK